MELLHDEVDSVGGLQIPGRECFKHEPLELTQPSIRLVRILPSLSPDQLIQCEMSHATTDASYECLSYRWGKEDSGYEILLNSKSFRVRQNLFYFLEHMRSGSTTSANTGQPIWIDALCIDQSSIHERNHQVAQMGAIYRGATLVKIWLGKCARLTYGYFSDEYYQGKEYPDSEWWLDQLEKPRLLNLNQTNGEISPLLVQIYKTYRKVDPSHVARDMEDRTKHYHSSGSFAPGSTTLQESIRRGYERAEKQKYLLRQILEEEFFSNEYWSRAWITQEIFVAKKAVVMLQKEEFPIATLLNVLWACEKAAVHNNKVVKKFALFLGFDNSGLPCLQPGGTSKSFLSLLRQFSDKNCAIPRDRLYSLLSLYCNGDKVAIDYAQPDDELLCHIVERLNEPTALCSIVNLTRSLMPQSEPLGAAFIEIDVPHLLLEWTPTDILACQSTTLQAQSQHNLRQLINIKHSETPCVFLRKVLEMLHGRATLIESQPTTAEEPDFTSYGRQIMMLTPSETGMQLKDIMPPSGNDVGTSTLRMYAHDFSIRMADKEASLWTLRIRLSVIWTVLGTADPMELCKSLHRFSHGGICTHVRMGCGPL